MKITIGSRGSALALKQTELVIEQLKTAYPEYDYEIKVIHTKGDKILDVALDKMNDKGIFVKEIEKELLEGTIDLAVHSLKDMPSSQPDGLTYTKTLAASDHRDCLVLKTANSLDDLAHGAVIATGSKRRRYQLKQLRPDLKFVDIRGNINTRLKKLQEQEIDGLVLASAGLLRLQLEDKISQYLDEAMMVPACGQGILAIQVKENSPLIKMINAISDEAANQRLKWERLFLSEVDGSCHIPVGGYANVVGEDLHFLALLGNEEGTVLLKEEIVCKEAEAESKIRALAKQMKEKI
ncbi:hydroxymethylbilane synthase [Beduini massiliensis]|uniref:hydroxymethylbilane synthase n=1 Tax=Beduini massiliensis TaxID=1585974 RepID=UPI00059A96FF|nr:hydroxymethylbilane synthase [Beduini massiliensis]